MGNPDLGQMLARGEAFFAPAAWNPATARLAWDLGFKALSLPASVAGVALGEGEPMLNLTQVATLAERALEAVSDELPMIVDAMSGFGNPNHVRLTVKTLESAGVSAVQIGDGVYPAQVPVPGARYEAVSLEPAEQRTPLEEVCRNMGISDATFSNWRCTRAGTWDNLGQSEAKMSQNRDISRYQQISQVVESEIKAR